MGIKKLRMYMRRKDHFCPNSRPARPKTFQHDSPACADRSDIANAADFRQGVCNHAAIADLKSVVGIVVGRHAECKLGWVVGARAAGLLKNICNPGFTLWAHGFVPSTWFGTS